MIAPARPWTPRRLGGLLLILLAVPTAAHAVPRPPAVSAPPPSPRLDLLRGLGGADLVLFEPRHPPAPTRLMLAATVVASVARLRALLADPVTYRRAVPAFVRADPVGAADADGTLLIAW